MYGSGLDGMFTAMVAFCFLAGVAFCGLVFWLVPLVWGWVKPWLHMVTG